MHQAEAAEALQHLQPLARADVPVAPLLDLQADKLILQVFFSFWPQSACSNCGCHALDDLP